MVQVHLGPPPELPAQAPDRQAGHESALNLYRSTASGLVSPAGYRAARSMKVIGGMFQLALAVTSKP